MAEKPVKTRGLGRGLSALMADVAQDASSDQSRSRRSDLAVAIDRIVPNPHQPRRTFQEEPLADLAASIREKGIIQPLIVRAHPQQADHYEIVAGERRWRAAQMAQLHEIPVIVRSFSDTEVLEVAIIENIQRADLNPVDEAAGYRQLMERFGHTQDQLATALGKSRSHIANQMRLLNLPPDVLRLLSDGQISAGHARALVGHDDALRLARLIVQKGLSVRETEALVKRGTGPGPRGAQGGGNRRAKDADTAQLEAELAAHLKMPVSIDHAAGSANGKLTISYKSLDQLDDLLRMLTGG
jgi:ParB family chromosome partitioning protein